MNVCASTHAALTFRSVNSIKVFLEVTEDLKVPTTLCPVRVRLYSVGVERTNSVELVILHFVGSFLKMPGMLGMTPMPASPRGTPNTSRIMSTQCL